MSFKSYRSSQSKFRRSNRRNVSAQAEPCELRALLSASAITVGLAEAAPCDTTEVEAGIVSDDAASSDVVDGKTTDVVDQNWDCLLACDGFMAPELDEAAIDTAEGEIPPMRFVTFNAAFIDDAGIADDSVPVEKTGLDELEYTDENFVVQDFAGEENAPSEEFDPSWTYRSFVAFGGGATEGELTDEVKENADDSEGKVNIYHSLNPDATDDGVVLEELVAIEDTPPVDGWDPSWLYRSFTGSPDGALDDAVKIDDIVLEDGVPVDEPESDNSNDGIDPVIFMTFGGVVEDSDIPVDDSGSGNSDQVTKDVTDSLDTGLDDGSLPVDDEISLDDPSVLAAEDSAPQIRYFSRGGPEVQRTLVSSNGPAAALPAVAATPPVTSASLATNTSPSSLTTNNVPVRQTTSASLFNSSRDKAVSGVALTSQSDGGPIGSTIGTKSSSTPKRSKSQLQSISQNSDETSGLESLSPLIGDEADSSEVDAAPSQQDVQSEEQVTAEPSVISRDGSVESSSSVVVQNTRTSRTIRPGMIDEVMSQYAENSYNA